MTLLIIGLAIYYLLGWWCAFRHYLRQDMRISRGYGGTLTVPIGTLAGTVVVSILSAPAGPVMALLDYLGAPDGRGAKRITPERLTALARKVARV